MNLSRHFAKFMIFFGAAGFLLPSLARSIPPEPSPLVESQFEWIVSDDPGSKLQLQVRQMPLERILRAITAKTRIPIHYSIVPEGLVTATCVGPTLKHVMECLLARKADLIVRYHKLLDQSQAGVEAQDQAAEMWVLGSRFVSAPNCSSSALSPQAINNAPLQVADSQTDGVEAEPDRTEELLKQARSNDADVRAEAIGALMSGGREGDANVKRVLEEALNDHNARVRAQAISSLAQREGAGATAALQEALHDGDAGVRLMAIDGAGDNAALLQQAINDEDETVRQLAKSKLEELQKTVK
jgi:hypothetical protein